MEERQDEEGSGEGEIGEAAEGEPGSLVATMVEEEKSCCRGGDSAWDQRWSLMVEEREGDAENDESDGEEREVAKGITGCGVCRMGGVRPIAMFPVVDEETVEAAECCEECCEGEQRDAEVWTPGYGGCGEEEADGDLLWKAVSAAGCVYEDEVADEQAAEDEVEVNSLRFETGKKYCKREGCQQNSGEEGTAETVVEEVPGFELFR
jgi:hypothetical protein